MARIKNRPKFQQLREMPPDELVPLLKYGVPANYWCIIMGMLQAAGICKSPHPISHRANRKRLFSTFARQFLYAWKDGDGSFFRRLGDHIEQMSRQHRDKCPAAHPRLLCIYGLCNPQRMAEFFGGEDDHTNGQMTYSRILKALDGVGLPTSRTQLKRDLKHLNLSVAKAKAGRPQSQGRTRLIIKLRPASNRVQFSRRAV